MSTETTEKIEAIPTKERNEFQVFLAREMFGADISEERMLMWINEYAKKVSEIIDLDNGKIREYIMSGQYKEASDIVQTMLGDFSL